MTIRIYNLTKNYQCHLEFLIRPPKRLRKSGVSILIYYIHKHIKFQHPANSIDMVLFQPAPL